MKQSTWLDYSDIALLYQRKIEQAQTISVVIPTLNEEKCVGGIISLLKERLMGPLKIIDEIIVIDGGSTDATEAVVRKEGVTFLSLADGIGEQKKSVGKGLALWRGQFVTSGSIICYIDADIENFDERFILGLVGPLLKDESILFTKAFYSRPIINNAKTELDEGGRVTELLVRPLLSRFYPDAAQLIQPLSGEYAFRRDILASLRFSTGYAVEIVLLLEFLRKYSSLQIEQVDMGVRIHRNQSLKSLGKMSAAILDHFALLASEDGLWSNPGISQYMSLQDKSVVTLPIQQELLPPVHGIV